MKQTQSLKLGGLGANIGGSQWEIAKRKQEAAQRFANNVKEQNISKGGIPSRPYEEPYRETSNRERARQFAKNIPRPKPKP